MALRDKIQTKVGKAFDGKLSDAVTVFTGSRIIAGTGEYNPVTGEYAADPPPLVLSGRGVISGYSKQEVDGLNILATDKKLTALANELDFTPQIDDTVAGYKVLHVGQDAALATWKCQLRAV